MKKQKKPPYADRSDIDKIRSQWKKLTGLYSREEPSAAVVRAATAVELSVNLAIRAEFANQSELSANPSYSPDRVYRGGERSLTL